MKLPDVSPRTWTNLGFFLTLGVLALIGFRSSFGGWAFMLPAVGGLLAGMVIGTVAVGRRWPAITILACSLVAFLLLGGPLALRGTTIVGVIPTLETLRGLAIGATAGWKQLVTTLPPVGDLPPLLVVPFVTGLIGGVVGTWVALRFRIPAVALITPLVMLATGIAVGTRYPVSVLAQGAIFGAVALGWLAVRTPRQDAATTTQVDRSMQLRRLGLATGMLVVAGAVALPMGRILPFTDTNPRFTVRDQLEPPFDPRAFASPLGGIRRYSADLRTEPILTVSGLPEGKRLRLAVMDSYDGIVWGVAGSAVGKDGSSGVFERVGPEIPTEVVGDEVTMTVDVSGYSDVWLPDAGFLTSLKFEGPRAEELTQSFRYNRATGTGAVPVKLREGDRYTLTALVPPTPTKEQAAELPTDDTPVAEAPSIKAVKQLHDTLLQADPEGTERTPYEQALFLTTQLREQGYYSNGDAGQSRPQSLTGHGAYRLSTFSENDILVGDEEQYAATAGLLSSYSGLPTRVVVGAVAPANAADKWVIKGEDMTSWIEVGLGGTWVPLSVVPDKNKKVPQEEVVKQKPRLSPQQVLPPPPPEAAEAVTPEEIDSKDDQQDQSDDSFALPPLLVALLKYVGLPLALIAGAIGAMAGAKAYRRRRRRTMGDPAHRIAGGWREATDSARDHGVDLPDRATRRETASAMPGPAATLLAQRADEAVFGPEPPDPDAAEHFWRIVEEYRAESNAGLSWWQRLKATVSIRSWRRP